MAISAEESKEYLGKFDQFLIDSSDFILGCEVYLENYLKNKIELWGYSDSVSQYFIEELVSPYTVLGLLVFFIIVYKLLRGRY